MVASRIPEPTPFVPDVATFLKLIGRNCKDFESKLGTWETLFGSSSAQLRLMGIDPPRQRRYLMLWREKFRRGLFGPWGRLTHVTDGTAELRVVERAGGQKLVVNTPLSTADGFTHAALDAPADAVVAPEAKVAFPGVVSGPHCRPLKGTGGTVARVQIQEGLWEHQRGHKVGGGERLVRRAKTLVARRRRGINAT